MSPAAIGRVIFSHISAKAGSRVSSWHVATVREAASIQSLWEVKRTSGEAVDRFDPTRMTHHGPAVSG
jgi:hypothetical protein